MTQNSAHAGPAISVQNLTKTYRIEQRRENRFGWLKSFLFPKWETLTALDGVSFDIRPGEIVGFLGPNGAGKSTTIKILTASCIRPRDKLRCLDGPPTSIG